MAFGVNTTQAVILAAGNSERLGDLTKDRPKCLIEVGGRSLIDYSLMYLNAIGIREVLIVTGYCGDALRRAVGNGPPGLRVDYVDNPDYATTGSVVSLLVAARAARSAAFLLLESDLLSHPEFLRIALSDTRENVMLVADATGSGDEVFICAGADGSISFLGKAASETKRAQSLGEFAGITRMSRDTLDLYCAAAKRLLSGGKATGHYEELLFALMEAGTITVYARRCAGLPWTEVDVPRDLVRAEREVLPRIHAATAEALEA